MDKMLLIKPKIRKVTFLLRLQFKNNIDNTQAIFVNNLSILYMYVS